jgi:predicted unusual protein kinase regulating ubiquinone biosynthesis (AarF/ABC1/UbiB family)
MIFMFRTRYFRIVSFFFRTALSFIWWDVALNRIGFRKAAAKSRPARIQRVAAAFRKLAIRMGGVMIKVGQFLSARLDVLPREITDELTGLQDEVAPESFEDIREVAEAEFGCTLEERFAQFEPHPMASASIGQVHCAHLCKTSPEGEPCPPVVVKVQRPHIEEIVEVDLRAIREVGRWLMRWKMIRKHVNVPGLIEEFSRTLYEEMDYLNEGKNAETFAENFKDDIAIRVPKVIWSHTTKRVLTLEDVGAIKITDYEALEKADIPRKAVADRLVDTYFKQIFEDGFFHADPHPGNLFVKPEPTKNDPHAFVLTFIDFGMTGTLPKDTFTGMREVLLAVGTQDSKRMIRAFQTMNLLLPGADLDLLERATRRVLDRFWGKSTREMMNMHAEEAQQFFDEFGDLMYEMPFQVPNDLILFGRCVGILSGMASGLDPQFNVFDRLTPYIGKLVEAENGGGKAKLILDEILNMGKLLLALPQKTDALLSRIEAGKVEVKVPELREKLGRLERSQRKLTGAVVFGVFMVAGVQLYLAHELSLAAGFGAAALVTLVWLLVGR